MGSRLAAAPFLPLNSVQVFPLAMTLNFEKQRAMTDFIKPRLYLITPPVAEAESFAPALEAALDAGDVACVLLRFAPSDDGSRKKICRLLAPLAQDRGAALLLADDVQLVARAGADGAHVTGPGENFDAAMEILKPE